MENNTGKLEGCNHFIDETNTKIGRMVGLTVVSLLSLVGNLFVILIFKIQHATRRNTNLYFIVNMAASDLIFPLFVLPDQAVQIWLGDGRFLVGGPVGEFLSKFVTFTMDLSLAVSTQSLLAIAAERFIAVVHPLKVKRFTPRRRTILIIIIWIVAAVLSSPYFYFIRLFTTCNELHYYRKDWTPLFDTQAASKVYALVSIFLVVYVPLLIIAVLYTVLSIKMRGMAVPGCHVGNPQNIRRRQRNKRITKMSICIVIAFSLCLLPASIAIITVIFFAVRLSPLFYAVALNLAWANSAVNPWILFYFCSNFRRGLIEMFGCCPCFTQRSNRVVVRNNDVGKTSRTESIE